MNRFQTVMGKSRLGCGQKFILIVIVLALVGVLVVLGMLLRQDAFVSPLSTLAIPSPGIIETPIIRTNVTRTPTAVTVQVIVTPEQISPTPSSPGPAAEVLAVRRIEALTRDVGQIRELPKQQEIPLNFLSDQDMATYLRRVLADSERQNFVRRQQALLAAFDLSPAPSEAFPSTVQTRVDHLIAFYDSTEEQIFISMAGRDSDPPDISLVHQYAHALVDQHFSLSPPMSALSNADATRAWDALVEGDAMMVSIVHRFGSVDRINDGRILDELASHMAEVELTDYEGYLTSQAMHDVFLFPYREGARFVAALLRVGWWPTVNAAYLDPPISTEQILHPEKYLTSAQDKPRTVRLPNLSEDLGEGWRLVSQDVLGELLLRTHLEQYLPNTDEAWAAAAGWDGDLVAVWQDLEGREVLVMRILWDSADEAKEFARSYVNLVDRRLEGARRVVRSILPPDGRWWRGREANAYLEQAGNSVLVIWAPNTDTMERVLAVFVLDE